MGLQWSRAGAVLTCLNLNCASPVARAASGSDNCACLQPLTVVESFQDRLDGPPLG